MHLARKGEPSEMESGATLERTGKGIVATFLIVVKKKNPCQEVPKGGFLGLQFKAA